MPDTEKLAYTVPEAAKAIGLSRSTVFEMLHDGRLKGVKIGSRRLLRREELTRLLDDAEGRSSVAA